MPVTQSPLGTGATSQRLATLEVMADLGEALKLLRAAETHPADVRLATTADLIEAEVALGIAIPPDGRRFLLEVSSERVGLDEPGLVGGSTAASRPRANRAGGVGRMEGSSRAVPVLHR